MTALARQPSATPLLADAFASTFWIASMWRWRRVPALLLPRGRPKEVSEESAHSERESKAA